MSILVVGAEPREFAGLLPRLSGREKLAWPVYWARRAAGPLGEYILVANGAGAAHAAAATRTAIERAAPSAVVSFGFCGGLAPHLRVGDIFAASCVSAAARRFPAALPQTSRRFTSGTLVSVDRIATTAVEKAALQAAGADAVEMEAAGVAEVAFQARLPFFCVRSITDGLGDTFVLDWNAALRQDGHFATMFCLRQFLNRPAAAAPEFVRLWRRCRIAASNLGDFVADCRF